jgi:hypothetical protein
MGTSREMLVSSQATPGRYISGTNFNGGVKNEQSKYADPQDATPDKCAVPLGESQSKGTDEGND